MQLILGIIAILLIASNIDIITRLLWEACRLIGKILIYLLGVVVTIVFLSTMWQLLILVGLLPTLTSIDTIIFSAGITLGAGLLFVDGPDVINQLKNFFKNGVAE